METIETTTMNMPVLALRGLTIFPGCVISFDVERDISIRAVSALLSGEGGQQEWLTHVAQLEQKIDDMTASFRRDQLVRMRDGTCSDEACILYSELLTDFERIGDHVLNIAEELTKARTTL